MESAYAALRDKLYTVSDPTCIDSLLEEVSKVIVEVQDDFSNSETIDPIGSIANDLGSYAYRLAMKFDETNAKSYAATQFSSIVQQINSHVMNRTSDLPYGYSTVTSIANYYALFKSDDEGVLDIDMQLFTDGSGDYSTDYYFSQDFIELSQKIGLTLTNSNTKLTYVDGDTKALIQAI